MLFKGTVIFYIGWDILAVNSFGTVRVDTSGLSDSKIGSEIRLNEERKGIGAMNVGGSASGPVNFIDIVNGLEVDDASGHIG